MQVDSTRMRLLLASSCRTQRRPKLLEHGHGDLRHDELEIASMTTKGDFKGNLARHNRKLYNICDGHAADLDVGLRPLSTSHLCTGA